MQVPNHIAVILDGNRRWAKENDLPRFGHLEGAKKFDQFLNWCLELGIPQISAYALSTENFNRSKGELNEIFEVIKQFVQKYVDDGEILNKYEVRVKFLGDFHKLPRDLVGLMVKLMRKTAGHRKKALNILLGYSGRYELTQAVKRLVVNAFKSGRIQITQKSIEKNLLVQQPVDLVIRSGGFSRLSNFLLWQAAYAEMFVTNTLWPDFSKRELIKALKWYQSVKRNFGK